MFNRKQHTAESAAPPIDGDGNGAPSYFRWKFLSLGARRSGNAADYVVEFPDGRPIEQLFGTGIPVNRQYRKLAATPPIPVPARMTLSGPGVEVAQQFLLAPLSVSNPEAGGYGL